MPGNNPNAGTFTVTDADGQDHKLNANQSYLDRVTEGMTLDARAAKQAQGIRQLRGLQGADPTKNPGEE